MHGILGHDDDCDDGKSSECGRTSMDAFHGPIVRQTRVDARTSVSRKQVDRCAVRCGAVLSNEGTSYHEAVDTPNDSQVIIIISKRSCVSVLGMCSIIGRKWALVGYRFPR